ncbi:MAG: ABC transporter permease subunit [Planctomycetota bacterium]|nr:ABC transporter permease subunit [Planctomycetota bacterium]
MRGLAAIALTTFRETTRQPFYYLLLLAGVGALVITLWLPLFTFHNDTDMYKDLGLSFVLVFVMLVGLLAAATGVAREVEDKTAHTILAKAGVRWTFILGKYLGAMAAVTLAVLGLGAVLVICLYYRVELDASVVERPYTMGGMGEQVEAFWWRRVHQALTVVPGLVLVGLQVGVLSAVATALSARFSVAASVALALGVFVVGHLMVFLGQAARTATAPARAAAEVAMTLVPFLEIFNLNRHLSHTMLTPFDPASPGAEAWQEAWAYVGLAALYAVAYAAVALAVGALVFRRRSLS